MWNNKLISVQKKSRCFYLVDCWHPHVAPSCCPDILVLSSDVSASRTKARPTALSRQLNFCAKRLTSWGKNERWRRRRRGLDTSRGVLGETTISLREELSEIESYTVVTHSFAHPSRRPRFSLLSHQFFFAFLSFLSFLAFFRIRSPTRRVVCTGAKLSVISDGMARLTPARFYAPSWITWARTIVCSTRAWRWKLEKKWNSAPKCCDASIMKHRRSRESAGCARIRTAKFIIFNCPYFRQELMNVSWNYVKKVEWKILTCEICTKRL